MRTSQYPESFRHIGNFLSIFTGWQNYRTNDKLLNLNVNLWNTEWAIQI